MTSMKNSIRYEKYREMEHTNKLKTLDGASSHELGMQ